MKRLSIALTMILAIPMLSAARSPAQSMEDLNLQVHGYATQSFLYSTNNNWNTTDSSNGSAAWTEAVVNLSAQPQPRLRIGVQARYSLLGNYGNQITLDWAGADVKVNESFGFRAGKVKTPSGLLNESQDIDPAHLWILLPQSIYPISSRGTILAHYGGVAYGSVALGRSLGKVEYRVFGGARVISSNDGFFQDVRDAGLDVPNGMTGPTFGGELMWETPIQGLLLGAYESSDRLSGVVAAGPFQGTLSLAGLQPSSFFARYERNRIMVAGEYARLAFRPTMLFPGQAPNILYIDKRQFYAMASYRVVEKLNAGLYYSSVIDRKEVVATVAHQSDWAITTRYDFNPYLYLKLEQHFIDGTQIGYSTSDNPDGLKPNSRMTLLKLGVSF